MVVRGLLVAGVENPAVFEAVDFRCHVSARGSRQLFRVGLCHDSCVVFDVCTSAWVNLIRGAVGEIKGTVRPSWTKMNNKDLIAPGKMKVKYKQRVSVSGRFAAVQIN